MADWVDSWPWPGTGILDLFDLRGLEWPDEDIVAILEQDSMKVPEEDESDG